MYAYRDIFQSPETRRVHSVKLFGASDIVAPKLHRLQVDQRPEVDLNALEHNGEAVGPGLFVKMAVRGTTDVACAWRDAERQQSGRGPCWLLPPSGRPINLGFMHSASCGFGPDGRLWVPRTPQGHVTIHEWDGSQVGEDVLPEHSEGIWYFDAQGRPVIRKPHNAWFWPIAGVMVYEPREIGEWAVGFADVANIQGFAGGFVLIDRRNTNNPVVRMWPVYSAHDAKLIVDDAGHPHVAVSGPHSPEPRDFMTQLEPLRMFVAPAPAIPIVTGYDLVIDGPLPPAWYWQQSDGVTSLPPGAAAVWSEAPAALGDRRLVYEDQANYPIAADRELIAGAWSTERAAGGLDGLRRQIAAVREKMTAPHAPPAIYIHTDGDSHEHVELAREAMRVLEEAGVYGLPGIHVTGAGCPEALARDYHQRYGRYGQSWAFHFGWTNDGYTFTGPQLAAAHRHGLQLHAGLPAEAFSCFGWNRKGGPQHCPELEAFGWELERSLGTPGLRLGARPVTPDAPVPSLSSPDDDVAARPDHSTEWVKLIGAAIPLGIGVVVGIRALAVRHGLSDEDINRAESAAAADSRRRADERDAMSRPSNVSDTN